MRALLTLLGLLFAVAGCESRVSLGAPCASDRECAVPYRCTASRCRVECVDDAACGLGGRCLLVAPGVGGCVVAAEDAGPSLDVAASPDAGPFDSPRLCRDVTSCGEGEICSNDFAPGVCRAACTAHSDCPRSGVCDWYRADSGEHVLGCASHCLPGTDMGCPADTTCRMALRDPAEIPAGPPSLTLCATYSPDRGEHCACENLDSGAQCAAGLSCEAPLEGRMCLRICEVGTMCTADTRCERTPRSLVVEGREYGVCPPTVTAPLDCP